jgi:hypothetical protein
MYHFGQKGELGAFWAILPQTHLVTLADAEDPYKTIIFVTDGHMKSDGLDM